MRSTIAASTGIALAAVLALSAVGLADGDRKFTRGPVLAFPEPGTVVVFGHTKEARALTAQFQINGNTISAANTHGEGAQTKHRFEVKVPAGTAFQYTIKGPDGVYAQHSSRSPAKAGESFRFGIIGDSGSGDKNQAAVTRILEAQKPDFMLHTGDIVYSSGEPERQNPRFFWPYRKLLPTTPFFVSLGNHDVKTRNGAPTLEAHELPHNNPANTERYYSYDWGDAHFVALESTAMLRNSKFETSAQGRWLEADLAATTKKWRFVFFHHPPYSCMTKRIFTELVARRRVSKMFERHGVDAVFCGHDHLYHRTKPMKAHRAHPDGIVYIVSGGGGRGLYKGTRRTYSAGFALRHNCVIVDIKGDELKLRTWSPGKDGKAELIDAATIKARR